MSEIRCRFVATDQPRAIVDHHLDDCAGDCSGCLPCDSTHCLVCSKNHTPSVCADCLADTRDTLHAIGVLCGALDREAVVKGVDSTAAMLAGPAANPEAWRNRAMSAMRGRVDAAYLEDCKDELHPLWVLGTWEQVARDTLDQPTDLAATLPRLVDYLNRQLHVLAVSLDFDFATMAKEFRGCLGHLEAVIHDQPQGDRANIGCFDCGRELERKLLKDGFDDHWTCRGCRRRYTYAEYNFALRAALEVAQKEAS
jgi:hypothetical protein